MLVVENDGVAVWEDGGRRRLWDGIAVAAFPDGSGGAVIEVDDGRRFEWDAELGRYRVTSSELARVLRVTAGGTISPLLEDESEVIHTLIDVADLRGRPTAVLSRAVPGSPCCGEPEVASAASGSILSYLVLRDLETGSETSYGLVATYESDVVIAAFGGDTVAMATWFYGAGIGAPRWAPLASLIPAEQRSEDPEHWLDEPCARGQCVPVLATGPCDQHADCLPMAGTPSVAPDGSAVAFVESLEVPDSAVALDHGVQVVVADLASGSERWRVRLEGFNRHDNIWPTAVDFDGTRVLVSFPGPGVSATGTAVLVDETGEVARTAIPGPAVFWHR